MDKEEQRFEAMQMNMNETNTIALKNMSVRLDRIESNLESLIEDFVEHCHDEDDDDGGRPKDGTTIKLSGVGRFKI